MGIVVQRHPRAMSNSAAGAMGIPTCPNTTVLRLTLYAKKRRTGKQVLSGREIPQSALESLSPNVPPAALA